VAIPYSNADHVLLKIARNLFNSLYERRLLIRMLGIRFTHLIPGNYQISLFDDTTESINLYQAIDSVKHRFGEELVKRARGVRA
jgi:DNA polymerase-4